MTKNKVVYDEYMFVRDNHGNGPLVVFLHGVGSSSEMWAKHLEELTNYHCMAVDLPGHGNSRDIKWTSIQEVADSIYELVKTSKEGKAHFVGLSLGGSLVLNLLARHSEIFLSAIVDGAGVFPIKGKEFIKFGVFLTSPFLGVGWFNKMMANQLGVTEEAEYQKFKKDMELVSPSAFWRAFGQANDQGEPRGLTASKVRTLLVCGESEDINSGKYLASKMINAKAAMIKGVGHGWLAKKTDLHVEMVKAWISETPLPEEIVSL